MISIRAKSEVGRQKLEVRVPEWWQAVPAEEKQVLRNFTRMMGGMKQSRRARVARAAAKWDRRLRCFIKVRLIAEQQRAERRNRKWAGGGKGVAA